MKKSVIISLIAVVLAVCGIGGYAYHENQVDKMQEAGVSMLKASVNLGDYREAEQAKINEVLNAAEAKIRECKDEGEIDSLVKSAAEELEGLKTNAQYSRDEGVSRLKAMVNLEDYREAEQAEIDNILSNAENKIKDSKDETEIEAILKTTSESLAEIKTDAEYSEEEAAAAAAAAAASKKSSKKKSSGSSGGCVGGGSDMFY